ncbi:MAG: VanW family protein, partial [Patescibacteria group bacterium]
NRIININNGLSKFAGHLVKPGEEFVFGNTLGTVDGSTGYLKELVIKGDKTVPEYGGGLCQVSTTAYRAVLAAGFPVTARRNHSYAVSYYKPLGLDATVYPPTVELKFINDSPNHLLMQSFTVGNKAYYNFYGTKTNRMVHMIGPYYSSWVSPPDKRVEYSGNLGPGETQIVGHAVPGVNVTWYRYVTYNDEFTKDEKTGEKKNKSFIETIYSKYQARPDYYLVGKTEDVPEHVSEDGT